MRVFRFNSHSYAATTPASPTLVIGLGEFGRRALELLDEVTATRSPLKEVVLVWATSAGWYARGEDSPPWMAPELPMSVELEPPSAPARSSLLAPTCAESGLDTAAWHETHEAAALELLGSAIEGIQSRAAVEGALDIFILADMQEPEEFELWPLVLTTARKAAVPFSDYLFTLIFATDSRGFTRLDLHRAEIVRRRLSAVDQVLSLATDSRELPGRIGWCYLIDTVDTHGYPANAPGGPSISGTTMDEPRTVQLHTVVEFICLLVGGLRHSERYQRLSLANLQRGLRLAERAARVAVFSASSLVMPLEHIADRARDELALRLLDEHYLADARPRDLPVASKLAQRWLLESGLEPAELRRTILCDAGGQPLAFSLEPPDLRLIFDDDPELLPDKLRNWDQVLQRRWQRADSPKQQMEENAAQAREQAARWLERELDHLLQREPAGLPRAKLLIREGDAALLLERQKADVRPVERGWLAWLVSGIVRRRDAAEIPDLEAGLKRLALALAKRVNRRAVWMRASLVGATLLSFAWAAYLAAGDMLGLHGLAAALFGRAESWLTRPLDMLALAMICWLAALVGGALTILRSEGAVIRAAERCSDDVYLKYEALIERTLRAEREAVYGGLLSHLTALRETISARRETLQQARAVLLEWSAGAGSPTHLLTECSLLPEQQRRALMPVTDPAMDADAAVSFLEQERKSGWRDETPEAFSAALLAFAEDRLLEWRAGLADRAARLAPDAWNRLVEVRSRLRPYLPLDREERGAVAAGAALPLDAADHLETAKASALVMIPPGWETEGEMPQFEWDELVRGTEEGRLACLSMIHGLRLDGLRIWATLPKAKSEEATASGVEGVTDVDHSHIRSVEPVGALSGADPSPA